MLMVGTPVLLRAICGSRYRSVITIVSLLLAENYFALWVDLIYGPKILNSEFTESIIWGDAIGIGINYLTMLISHFELAWIY